MLYHERLGFDRQFWGEGCRHSILIRRHFHLHVRRCTKIPGSEKNPPKLLSLQAALGVVRAPMGKAGHSRANPHMLR